MPSPSTPFIDHFGSSSEPSSFEKAQILLIELDRLTAYSTSLQEQSNKLCANGQVLCSHALSLRQDSEVLLEILRHEAR